MDNFSRRMAAIRRERGLNQYKLAELCGVSVDSIRRWEWGKQEPRLTDLISLAAALGVSVAKLVGEEEEKIIIQRGGVRLELPATAEGFALAAARLQESNTAEVAPQSGDTM